MSDIEEQVDRLLSQFGEQWRTSLPEPEPLDVAGLVRRRGTRRSFSWSIANAASLAVVLITVVTMLALLVVGPLGSHPASNAPTIPAVSPSATASQPEPSSEPASLTPSCQHVLAGEPQSRPTIVLAPPIFTDRTGLVLSCSSFDEQWNSSMAIVVLQNIDEPVNRKLQIAWSVTECEGTDEVVFAGSDGRFTVEINRRTGSTCQTVAVRRLRLDLAEPISTEQIQLNRVVSTPVPSASSPVQWREPASYTFTLESACGERALIGRFHVEVQSGQTVRVQALSGYWASHPLSPSAVPTLANLLTHAADARSRGASQVTVVLDPIDGHPVSVSVDWQTNTIDDEECYEITDYLPD